MRIAKAAPQRPDKHAAEPRARHLRHGRCRLKLAVGFHQPLPARTADGMKSEVRHVEQHAERADQQRDRRTGSRSAADRAAC